MQRTVGSFALATLSLLTSYAIVAIWPDGVVANPPEKPTIAELARADVADVSAMLRTAN